MNVFVVNHADYGDIGVSGVASTMQAANEIVERRKRHLGWRAAHFAFAIEEWTIDGILVSTHDVPRMTPKEAAL